MSSISVFRERRALAAVTATRKEREGGKIQEAYRGVGVGAYRWAAISHLGQKRNRKAGAISRGEKNEEKPESTPPPS